MVNDQQFAPEEESGLVDLVAAFKRRKKLSIITVVAILVIGIIIVVILPNSYQSTATILLEEPEVPEALIQTTVTVFATQQIQYINQRVMTRTNLANIIEKFNLYPEKRKYTPTLLLTDEVQDAMFLELITVELNQPGSVLPIPNTIAFVIGFEDPSPTVAQKVTNELVSLYMEENVRSRTVQTAETTEFLNQEVNRLDLRVKGLEEKIAQFKQGNEGSLPAMVQVNLTAMQRIDSQLLEVDRELNRIQESRIYLDAQLAQLDPTKPMILPDGSAVLSPENQLKSLQTRLASLLGIYSEEHPDVARTRREILSLQEQTGLTADLSELAAVLADVRRNLGLARENYSVDHPEVKRLERSEAELILRMQGQRDVNDALVKPDNPAYVQLAAQKNVLAADEKATRERKVELLQQLQEYEDRMMKAPNVEQELVALQRQLRSAAEQYYAMSDRQFGAEMGESLESQSKGERFVLVEPANMPLEPSSPNRPVLFFVVIVLALAVGVGLVPLVESMDSSIWGSKMLIDIQGGPPIAEIPLIMTGAELAHSRRIRIAAWISVPVTIAFAAVMIHFLLRPLDVLWYLVLRNLGI